MIGKYVSLNGELIPIEEAVVPIDNLEFTYGYGVYEALKVRNDILFFIDEHAQRLLQSAEIIGIKSELTPDIIKQYIITFSKSVEQNSFNIKVLLVGTNLHIFATNHKYL